MAQAKKQKKKTEKTEPGVKIQTGPYPTGKNSWSYGSKIQPQSKFSGGTSNQARKGLGSRGK